VNHNYSGQPRYEPVVGGREGGTDNQNGYFNKYATSYDSRNAVRDTQAAVYEDKDYEHLKNDRAFLTRSMDYHFFDKDEMTKMADAAASLKPLRDDYQTDYRAVSKKK